MGCVVAWRGVAAIVVAVVQCTHHTQPLYSVSVGAEMRGCRLGSTSLCHAVRGWLSPAWLGSAWHGSPWLGLALSAWLASPPVRSARPGLWLGRLGRLAADLA